jgi:hypothetical protein
MPHRLRELLKAVLVDLAMTFHGIGRMGPQFTSLWFVGTIVVLSRR